MDVVGVSLHQTSLVPRPFPPPPMKNGGKKKERKVEERVWQLLHVCVCSVGMSTEPIICRMSRDFT